MRHAPFALAAAAALAWGAVQAQPPPDVAARVLELKDHSHLSEILAVGTPDRSLSDPVLAFIRAGGR